MICPECGCKDIKRIVYFQKMYLIDGDNNLLTEFQINNTNEINTSYDKDFVCCECGYTSDEVNDFLY